MKPSIALLFVCVSAILSEPATVFEVASVKAVPETGGWIAPHVDDPLRFRALNSVHRLIEWAYSVRDFQILGAPEWLKRERFEIQATAASPSNEKQMKQLLQALLADRFGLRLHHETKDLPVYALVVGKNGPKLQPAKDASLNEGRGDVRVGKGALGAKGATMALFATILTDNLDRPVLDETGLTGHYDFEMTYDQTGPDYTFTGPDILIPLQYLGLKLEPKREPVDMLVIDSVGRPSGN